jgi:DNA-binding transcriptional ArsR family regulator
VNTYQEAQLDALGDATRRAILNQLLDGPVSVGELAEKFPMSRPAISQHLKILKDAELVLDRAEGNRRLYQINSEGFDSLRDYFDQFWTQALDAFKKKVEQKNAKRKRKSAQP